MARSRRKIPKNVRLLVLTEAGYRCAVPTCRAILAIDIHHMVKVSEGGGEDVGNLLALCPTCHALHHRGEIPSESIRIWKTALSPGGLELVDLNFEPADPDVLDIKFRNTSSKVAYIKRAIITVEKIWRLRPVLWYCAKIVRTGAYDVNLSIKRTPYELNIPVSQAINAGGVDRFGLMMCVDTKSALYESDCDYVLRTSIQFLYDSDSKVLSAGSALYASYNRLGIYYADSRGGPRLGGLLGEDTHASTESNGATEGRASWPGEWAKFFQQAPAKGILAAKKNREFLEMMARDSAPKNKDFIELLNVLSAATREFEQGVERQDR